MGTGDGSTHTEDEDFPEGETMADRFRRKPTEIEAVQITWKNWSDVCDFTGGAISNDNPAWNIEESEASDTCGETGPDFIALRLTTAHGDLTIFRHGDWIIPDSKPGTFYPCKPDIFAATYERIEE